MYMNLAGPRNTKLYYRLPLFNDETVCVFMLLTKDNSMTKTQINYLLRIHRGQRDRAKRMLDQRYEELEDRDEETEWIRTYVKHKGIVEKLEREKPDDWE